MQRHYMPLAAILLTLLLAAAAPAADRPKLIVIVSVDQMCQDYLIRFRDNFSPVGAFRRVFDHGLDGAVGQGNWTFGLTADHAVAPIVEYATQFKLPAVRNPLGSLTTVKDKLEARLRQQLHVPTADKPIVLKNEVPNTPTNARGYEDSYFPSLSAA